MRRVSYEAVDFRLYKGINVNDWGVSFERPDAELFLENSDASRIRSILFNEANDILRRSRAETADV